ncbi:hypothetical protein QJS10_CPB12g01012 [Acorus calamus]|uniref:Uncharacterized protein n=1 Tax=Acorus calamus TaxID=4465 RepID=A0AAV9DNR1_ACOCL|nr:hypothetical protein QJS10_CPB12g01012 [Acorus calamus]
MTQCICNLLSTCYVPSHASSVETHLTHLQTERQGGDHYRRHEGHQRHLSALNGAHVIIADIHDDTDHSLADSIGAKYIHCNVSREPDVESAVHLALAWQGHFDIMFNDAGVDWLTDPITALDRDKMRDLLSVNLGEAVHGIKHTARAMIDGRTAGCILYTASKAAIMSWLAPHAYSLSKDDSGAHEIDGMRAQGVLNQSELHLAAQGPVGNAGGDVLGSTPGRRCWAQ